MIDARKLPALRLKRDQLRDSYKRQKALLRSLPSGKAKGLAGHQLSLIGMEGRLVSQEIEMIETACKERGVMV
jgi:hypothetical protein